MGVKLGIREGHRLKVSDDGMLRGICGPRDEIIRGCRELHNEGLHNLYSSPNIIQMIKSRKMILAGHVACMGRIMHNIKPDLKETGWGGVVKGKVVPVLN
jgi:hypothetical protein